MKRVYEPGCSQLEEVDGVCIYYLEDAKGWGCGLCELPKKFRCTEAMQHMLPRLSFSAVKNFMKCPQLYYLSNILGIRRKKGHESFALQAGVIWDKFLSGKGSEIPTYIKEHNVDWKLECKVKALVKAFKNLGLHKPVTGMQKAVQLNINGVCIYGYVDEANDTEIFEDKCSGSPDFYSKKENIEPQIGTYLAADEAWEKATVRTVRLPGNKTGKGKYSDESEGAFTERIYQDIIKKPSYFFIGLNRKTRTYGNTFYRGEIDFDGIFTMYERVIAALKWTIEKDNWYPNALCCYAPMKCDMIDICKTGVVSEFLYEYRQHTES